jgi:hypothetical protein
MIRITESDRITGRLKFYTHDGTPIEGVGGATITAAPDQIPTATIELEVDKINIGRPFQSFAPQQRVRRDALGLKMIDKGEPVDPVLHAIAKRLASIEAILLQQQQLSQQAMLQVVDILRR